MINLHLIIHYHTIRPLIWSKRTAEVEIVRLTSTTPKLEIWISLTSEETFADLTKMLVLWSYIKPWTYDIILIAGDQHFDHYISPRSHFGSR